MKNRQDLVDKWGENNRWLVEGNDPLIILVDKIPEDKSEGLGYKKIECKLPMRETNSPRATP